MKDNLFNEDKKNQHKKEELHNKNRKNKIKRNIHLSIDCNTLNSNENLPLINITSHKELNKLNPIIIKSNKFLTIHNEQQNQYNKDIRLINDKYFTSKKLDKINLDESKHKTINSIHNIELINENSNNNVKLVRRHYKLKTHYNYEIKDTSIENKKL